MATGSWPTVLDIASRQVDGEQASFIAEYLSQAVCLMDDLPMSEANEITGHQFVYRTSIPGGTWAQYNQGTPYSKSTTAKSRVSTGTLKAYSQVDALLARDSGSPEKFRTGEDVAFLEGMGQTLEQTAWYGNTATTPAEFMGMSNFWNTVSTSKAQNAANVIDGGGTGNSNASFWLFGFGERSLFGIYPRGSKAGLHMDDKGDVVPAYDSVGNPYNAYTTYFEARMGIVPIDWRYTVRICNLDTTAAGLQGSSGPDLWALMTKAALIPPGMTKQTSGITKTDAPTDAVPTNRFVWMCNRTVRHYLDLQAMRNRNVLVGLNDAPGQVQMNWRGIPIKISDQLLNSESRVT